MTRDITKHSVAFVLVKRYLFIDAYNVIHATGELRSLLGKDVNSACNHLTEKVASIHDAEGIHTILVMDSSFESLKTEHPFGRETFELVYAPAQLSADGVIERLVMRVANPANVTVASNDSMIRECARVNQAIVITAAELIDWASACEKRLMQNVAQRRRLNEKKWRNTLEIDDGELGLR